MPEITDEMIAAARKHDHDTRPRGNWQAVPEQQVRRLLEGALAAAPFTETQEWCVFWGGGHPDDCAGSEVVSCEDEALEERQWRVTGGVARRSVLYGRWTVTVPPEADEPEETES